jgi:hypothetical protein
MRRRTTSLRAAGCREQPWDLPATSSPGSSCSPARWCGRVVLLRWPPWSSLRLEVRAIRVGLGRGRRGSVGGGVAGGQAVDDLVGERFYLGGWGGLEDAGADAGVEGVGDAGAGDHAWAGVVPRPVHPVLDVGEGFGGRRREDGVGPVDAYTCWARSGPMSIGAKSLSSIGPRQVPSAV